MTKFYRSSTNAVITGVCGGLGESLDIDPSLLRIITAVSFIFSFSVTFWVYVAAAIILPRN